MTIATKPSKRAQNEHQMENCKIMQFTGGWAGALPDTHTHTHIDT